MFSSTNKMFKCYLTGCKVSFRKHFKYIQHLKKVHINVNNIRCQYDNCTVTVKSIKLLIRHVKCHTQPTGEQVFVSSEYINCPQNCAGSVSQNRRNYYKHLKRHHNDERKICFISGCNYITSKSILSLKKHLSRKHKTEERANQREDEDNLEAAEGMIEDEDELEVMDGNEKLDEQLEYTKGESCIH